MWWKVVAVIVGGYLAYEVFLWLVSILRAMVPVVVVLGVLVLVGKFVLNRK